MRKLYYLILILILFSFSRISAGNDNSDKAPEEVLIVPKSKAKMFFGASTEQLGGNAFTTEWLANDEYCTTKAVSDSGWSILVKANVSNTAHNTFQVRCYRCGLGQRVGISSKQWCLENNYKWDLTKDAVKKVCK